MGALAHRQRQAVEVRAHNRADLPAGERQHRTVLVGQYDGLPANADARSGCSVDTGDVGRTADVGQRPRNSVPDAPIVKP